MRMTLYAERDSYIHKIDPFTKLIFVIVVAAIPYILPDHWLTAGLMVISILLLIIGKVFRKMLPIYAISLFLVFTIVIVQGLVGQDNVTPVLKLGPIVFYKEGLMYGLLLILRIFNMLSAFGVLILTTKPDDLIEVLVKRGMSPRIGYVIGSVFQIIPQMMSTISKITDAQRSRGLETEGKLSTRMKAFFPLIGPVIMNSLIATRERSIALEIRGFNSKQKKTFLFETEAVKLGGSFFPLLFISILIGAILWRIFLW